MLGIIPDELVLHIISFLDARPPSQVKERHEPSLSITDSEIHPLKDLSCVSHRWRQIVLPLLFQHTRIKLGAVEHSHWRNCPTRCLEVLGQDTERGFVYIPTNTLNSSHRPENDISGAEHFDMLHGDDQLSDFTTSASKPVQQASDPAIQWQWQIPQLYHHLDDFVSFIIEHDLVSNILSFILITHPVLPVALFRHLDKEQGNLEIRYRAVEAFWNRLLHTINPERVAILAPPIDLTCLMNFGLQTNDGDWAFGDMEYHLIALEHSGTEQSHSENYKLMPVGSLGKRKRSTLINMRQWHSISLNEGSFLKAYGTYEYFERGPPSLIYSINDGISFHAEPESITEPDHGINEQCNHSFTYTAIFPFASHLVNSVTTMIRNWNLRRLDLQLAPDASSTILDDRTRVGRAELEDCWHELLQAYQGICNRTTIEHNETRAEGNVSDPNQFGLLQFISRDAQNKIVREDLDRQAFPSLFGAGFQEIEPGLFEKE